MTKILVGIITHTGEKHCRDLFFKYLEKITTQVSFIIVTNSGEEDRKALEQRAQALKKKDNTVAVLANEQTEERLDQIISNRNVVRTYFLNGRWEYLYFLDSDLVGPTNAIDVLCKHKQKLMTGWYLGVFDHGGTPTLRPVSYAFHSEGKARQLQIKEVAIPRLLRLAAAGLGCCLIHRDILEKLTFHRTTGSEDALFFREAREQCGEELFLDTRIAYWHFKFAPTDKRTRMYDPRQYQK